MAGRLQLRRGTTLQNEAFTGAVGEPTLDTETGLIHIHDGQTQGGKEFIDPVVAFQVPTAGNNYTWYRRYASGWVEQGGRAEPGATSITLPVEMSDSDYQAILTYRKMSGNTGTPNYQYIATLTQTTTGFTIIATTSSYRNWRVGGMAAQGA